MIACPSAVLNTVLKIQVLSYFLEDSTIKESGGGASTVIAGDWGVIGAAAANST